MTTPNGQYALLACCPRNDRRGPGAGTATHAGGDETHVGVRQVIDDFVDALLGGGAADFRLRAGAKALGDMRAELDQPLGLGHGECLGVSIRHHEFNAAKTCRDHVVNSIAPTPADTEYGYPGFELGNVRSLKIDGHILVLCLPAASPSRLLWGGLAPPITRNCLSTTNSCAGTGRPFHSYATSHCH